MPEPTEVFNKLLDKHTLDRLKAEDSSALRFYQILNKSREEMYNKLLAMEARFTDAKERFSYIHLVQVMADVAQTMSRMEQEVTQEFRARMLAGYDAGQEQTYLELQAMQPAQFPPGFRPVTPQTPILNLIESQSDVLKEMNKRLGVHVGNELRRITPNISDAEALQRAGAGVEKVKDAIARGIVKGEGTASIARRLMHPVDGEFPRLANNTIVRTVRLAINESYNAGHDESIRQSAAKVPEIQRKWFSALVRSTRICIDLHGQACGVGENFKVQGKEIARPPAIGQGLKPSYHLCRSRVVPFSEAWPHNPKLDPLTEEEKEHFTKGGGRTAKQQGQGPRPTSNLADAKAAMAQRVKQLEENIKQKAKQAEARKLIEEQKKKKAAERALLARQKLIEQAKAKAEEEAKAKAIAERLKAGSSIFEAKDQAQLDEWAKYRYNRATLSSAEVDAVHAYQTPRKYKEINSGLRGKNNLGLTDGLGNVLDPQDLIDRNQHTIDDLDGLLGRHANTQEFKTFRGFHGQEPVDNWLAAVGGVIQDKGYVSTTPMRDVADMFSKPKLGSDIPSAFLELRVPKGTPNYYLNEVSDIGEAEILLGRGLHYRVLSHELKDGRHHFIAEVLTEAEVKELNKPKRGRPKGSKNKPKQHKYGLSRPEEDFRKFRDKYHCDEWGLKRYSVSGYNQNQVNALRVYQGSHYRGMNAGLRGLSLYGASPETLLNRYAEEIKELDNVLWEKTLEQPQFVVRGTDFVPLKEQVLKLVGGGIFEDPAYMSTTVEQQVAMRGFAHVYPRGDGTADTSPGSLMWRMYLPEGTPAFYLNALEDIGEAEILVGRGMKYRVLTHEVIDGVDWVTVEGLPHDEKAKRKRKA